MVLSEYKALYFLADSDTCSCWCSLMAYLVHEIVPVFVLVLVSVYGLEKVLCCGCLVEADIEKCPDRLS